MNSISALMKQIIAMALLAATLPVFGAANINWFTLDAAGEAQFSANYLVNFTAGQNDVAGATLTSARYKLMPGFWALEDLGPATGRPELLIVLSGGDVILSWPSPSPGYVLEQTDSFDVLPASWSNTPGAVSDNGILKSITISHSVAKRFYRLRKN